MDIVTWAGSFLLGGVSASLVMCLLLFFMERPLKKPKDKQVLKEIADALQALPESKEPQKILQSPGAETPGGLKILSENGFPKDHGEAARRLDMGYNPVPGLL